MHWAILILVFAFFLYIATDETVVDRQNKIIWRLHIKNDLRLLRDSLFRYKPLTEQLPAGDKPRAVELLARINATVDRVEPLYELAPYGKIYRLRSEVVSAMNDSKEVQKLLAKHSLLPTSDK